ncbi:phage protein NinX family protein [Morganella morganii]|uniref:phage protein NinX family protein n=1 Tax=Morganella morganii TaxID=582 RepID=UPI0034E5D7B7
MNKYRDKSDFEINKAVAEYYLTRAYRFNSADEVVELIDINLSCEFGGEINLVDTQAVGTFDPCNNPADAMPIIIENGISLISDWNEIGLWGATYQPWIYSENKNPYRAAMEVFLMIKDAENEKV